MKKTGDYRFGIGVPTLLMLCVVLALTTLGVLSYTSGRASLSLTNRTVDMTRQYYEAAETAQETLSRLDAELARLRAEAADDAAYERLVAAYAAENGMTYEDAALSWTIPAGGARRLSLSAAVYPRSRPGARYALIRHALTSEDLIDEDKPLNLYH